MCGNETCCGGGRAYCPKGAKRVTAAVFAKQIGADREIRRAYCPGRGKAGRRGRICEANRRGAR